MHEKNTMVIANVMCGELDVALVRLGKVTSSQEAINGLEKQGLRPGNLQNLLTFRDKCPAEYMKHAVVAFGDIRRGPYDCRNIPCLGEEKSKPGLSLHWFDTEWGNKHWFMGIKK